MVLELLILEKRVAKKKYRKKHENLIEFLKCVMNDNSGGNKPRHDQVDHAQSGLGHLQPRRWEWDDFLSQPGLTHLLVDAFRGRGDSKKMFGRSANRGGRITWPD